ncbi:MAG: hypothetical protein GTN93_10430 [Anaerolineae bacterium]|nr:hypothetical protein [Anaerolineae bacterium]
MIQTLTNGITTDLGVTLLDASDVAVTGVAFGAVTVEYKKNGDTAFTGKTVLSGDWTEVGGGLYRLTFAGSELDRDGTFLYKVTGASWDRYENTVIVQTDYLDLAAQIVEIKQLLALKTNITDADALFSQLEIRISELEAAIDDFKLRLDHAEAQLAALRTT